MMRQDRSLFIWLSVVSSIMIISVSLGAWAVHNSINALRAQQLHSCERDNVKAAQDNASHLQDYYVDSFVVQRFTVPTKTETAAQRKITSEFASTLHSAVAEKSWVPLVDCSVAISAEGSSYTPPQPVPFSRGPATVGALDPRTAGRPSPPNSTP